MEALKEITDWGDHKAPNHTYLLDGTTLVAYIKQGEKEPFFFKNGIKNFSKTRRKFVKADKKLFGSTVKSNLIEVNGSKGNVYFVDKETKTCTCPGFTFRGTCKHIGEVCGN
jgi:hypothetical protein